LSSQFSKLTPPLSFYSFHSAKSFHSDSKLKSLRVFKSKFAVEFNTPLFSNNKSFLFLLTKWVGEYFHGSLTEKKINIPE
jgi:hypothetical protein